MLVWDESIPTNVSETSASKRQIFESNLEKEGLQMEYVDTPGVSLHFIKLHAPDEVLRRYAEILKLRMPMKLVIVIELVFFFFYMFTLSNFNYKNSWSKM